MNLRRFATALAWCLVPVALHAQLPPLGIPRGMLRVEVQGSFGSATSGYVDGTRMDLGADLTSPALGPTELPFLDEPSRRIGAMIGATGYQLNLGASEGFANQTRSFGTLGFGLGLSERISVFARVPLVYATARRTAAVTANGDAGANGADPVLGTPSGRASAESFFAEFDSGLLALQGNIAAGAYDADPAQRALAEQTLAGGAAFRDSLRAVVLDEGTASPYLPIASSSAGAALAGRVTSLQATLSGSLAVTDFTSPLPLPGSSDFTFDALSALASDPTGDYQYTSYGGQKGIALGDVEVGTALTFIDTWDRGSLGGFRLAVEGLIRLPTGKKQDPDAGYPAPFNGGQTDVQVQAAADLGRGNFGARVNGGYLLQMASTVTRRVAAPGTLLVPVTSRTDVSLNPGDELFLGVTPFYRLARPLALLASLTWRHRSDDAASYSGTGIPGVDPAILGEGTGYSTILFSVGMNYSEINGRAGSRAKAPLDAGWSWENVIAASGGRVAKTSTVRLLLRLYGRLW